MSDPGGGPAPACPAVAPARIVIEAVEPIVDGGRFAAKRLVGDEVRITADIFAEGHDALACEVLCRAPDTEGAHAVPMNFLGNDRWEARIRVDVLGRHEFVLKGWIDSYGSWLEALRKRVAAGRVGPLDVREGAALMARASGNSGSSHTLLTAADRLASAGPAEALAIAEDAAELVRGAQERHSLASTEAFFIDVERERAGSGAWYEMFPRSAGEGTFGAAEACLPYVASMGFDVLYLPPIHPIGASHRKGPNNALDAGPSDPGSPWAIGSSEGGHTAIDRGLGTFDDFAHFVAAAAGHGLEVALDIAFQCSPDHPWLIEHPSWFRHRADGSVAFAENPPKAYEDIVPLDFESEDWQALWAALRDVFLFWIERGIKLFRVDNPHTKPFPFWEWVITDLRTAHPDVVLLAEAFTRPAVMRRLAKVGFSQSYTYFTWRDEPGELAEYLRELSESPISEYMRPSLWPNTPDILTAYLQENGPAAFALRFALAATLSPNYGIYGPAFELGDHTPLEPGSEEYRDSEKYQLRTWEIDDPATLRPLITEVNALRREHAALRRPGVLRFHACDNPNLLVYTRATPDFSDVVLVVANFDLRARQEGRFEIEFPRAESIEWSPSLGEGLHWEGRSGMVELDPANGPVLIAALAQS